VVSSKGTLHLCPVKLWLLCWHLGEAGIYVLVAPFAHWSCGQNRFKSAVCVALLRGAIQVVMQAVCDFFVAGCHSILVGRWSHPRVPSSLSNGAVVKAVTSSLSKQFGEGLDLRVSSFRGRQNSGRLESTGPSPHRNVHLVTSSGGQCGFNTVTSSLSN